MHFNHTDIDILESCPRNIDLIDETRVTFFALNIRNLVKFLYCLKELLGDNWLKELIKLTNKKEIEEYLFSTLAIKYQNHNNNKFTVFKKFDFISFYWCLLNKETSILPVLEPFKAFLTIIEQNNLIDILKLQYEDNGNENNKITYTNSFTIYEIMSLNLIPNLTFMNADDLLTMEQKNFYSNLKKQSDNKLIQNLYIALVTGIGNQFGAKIDLINDVLFPDNSEKDKLNLLERNKKEFLKEKYTGKPEIDNILINEFLEKNPNMPKDLFYSSNLESNS